MLYVDRQGASFPIGCMLPRIVRLSREQREVGVKQIVKLPTRNKYAVSGIKEIYERIYKKRKTHAIARAFAANTSSLLIEKLRKSFKVE